MTYFSFRFALSDAFTGFILLLRKRIVPVRPDIYRHASVIDGVIATDLPGTGIEFVGLTLFQFQLFAGGNDAFFLPDAFEGKGGFEFVAGFIIGGYLKGLAFIFRLETLRCRMAVKVHGFIIDLYIIKMVVKDDQFQLIGFDGFSVFDLDSFAVLIGSFFVEGRLFVDRQVFRHADRVLVLAGGASLST